MRWCAPGFEASLDRLLAAFRGAPWPSVPPGFAPLEAPRPMRAVLRGTVTGPDGPRTVVVKRSHPASLTDRLSCALRGGKGAREGRVLRALAEHGVAVPRVLAFLDGAEDLLVLAEVPDLLPPPDPAHPPPAAVAAVAALLARAHAAGLVHRDLTRENLAWTREGPLLLDLGGARLARPLRARWLVRELARARNGLLGDVTRTARRRALRVYANLVLPPEWAREIGRHLALAVEREAARQALRYRRGRDRRATRSGTRYETFRRPDGLRGVRASRDAPAAWVEQGATLIRGDLAGAEPLKPHGRILRSRLPGRDGPVVVKRFDRVAPGRLPRAVASFRRAVALRHRFVPTPDPLLAVADATGASALVTAFQEGTDLRRLAASGAPDLGQVLQAVGRTLRRMHDAGVANRDLKAENLLVVGGGAHPVVLVADVEGVRILRRAVAWRRRARDLGRLDASLDLDPALRGAWIAAYHDVLPRPPVPRDAFAARIAARAAWKRTRAARRS